MMMTSISAASQVIGNKNMNEVIWQDNDFAKSILQGLSSIPKRIPSRFFYDDAGSALFQKIMEMDNYYLTKAESEIMHTQADDLIQLILREKEKLSIIELGAGDGTKTKVFLKALTEKFYEITYTAIDISIQALNALEKSMNEMLPSLSLDLVEGDYFEKLEMMKPSIDSTKLVLFLGSNLGNYNSEESVEFLIKVRKSLHPGDWFLIGLDLKKDPEIILKAYNDKEGITRDFNLNLLKRINKELLGNFDVSQFAHYPVYDEEKGEARSYIKSLGQQNVRIEKLAMDVRFGEGELIYTEMSRKFDLEQISWLAQQSGFEVVENYQDTRKFFCDSLWKVI